MALSEVKIVSGINKQVTPTGAEGKWIDCDNVRFRYGYPEKIGGWEQTKLDKNQTNVYGKKTDFFAFNEEENYVLFLRYMIDKIVNSLEGHIFNHFDTKFEVQAWSNVLEKDDYVQNHNHTCYHSILYLSEGADLVLPELGLSLSPRCGDWYLLPPYVLHYCNKYNKEQKRYSLISNFVDKNDWQELKNKKIIT